MSLIIINDAINDTNYATMIITNYATIISTYYDTSDDIRCMFCTPNINPAPHSYVLVACPSTPLICTSQSLVCH